MIPLHNHLVVINNRAFF